MQDIRDVPLADDESKRSAKVLVKVPPQRKHAASGSNSWKDTPLSRMLIRNDDASNMTSIRIPLGLLAKEKALVLAVMVSSPPPVYLDLAGKAMCGRLFFMIYYP